jgi:putative hydrolase of HD superfamily
MCNNNSVKPDKLAKRLLDLQQLLLHFLDIERMILLPDAARNDRLETDTEHSFHLAMLAWYLSSHYPHLDKAKVIQLALAHDVVEIYAGDDMAIGRTKEQEKQKKEREAEALVRLKKEWPDFPDLTEMIESYDKKDCPEAVFVSALDKLTPMFHQILSKGKTWKKWDMSRSDVFENKDNKTAKSKEINDIWQVFRKEILEHDEWFNEGKAS